SSWPATEPANSAGTALREAVGAGPVVAGQRNRDNFGAAGQASDAAAYEANVPADPSVRSLTDMNADPSWLTRPDLYVTFRKPIESDNDRNLKAIPRKQRAMV